MKPLVSIIMGSTSDLPVMEKACKWLNDNQIYSIIPAVPLLWHISEPSIWVAITLSASSR